jgi:hypothetical protein
MILATEEAEFRTIMVEVLRREIIQDTPSWSVLGWWCGSTGRTPA